MPRPRVGRVNDNSQTATESASGVMLSHAPPHSMGWNRYRGSYFHHWKGERKLIKILMSCPLPLQYHRRVYAIARFIYYRILPRLLARIHYQVDRLDLLNLENHYYHTMNTWAWQNGKVRRINRLVGSLCVLDVKQRYYARRHKKDKDVPTCEVTC